MNRAIVFLLFVFCLLPVETAKAAAIVSEEGQYVVVSGVHVQDSAKDATIARNQAFDKGLQQAIQAIAQQKIPATAQAQFKSPSVAALTNMVADFETQSEKSSATHYMADFTFRFYKKQILGILPAGSFQQPAPASDMTSAALPSTEGVDNSDLSNIADQISADVQKSVQQNNAPSQTQPSVSNVTNNLIPKTVPPLALGSTTQMQNFQLIVQYQNLPQWLYLQKKLKNLTGVSNLTPYQIQTTQSVLRIDYLGSSPMLQTMLQKNGFDIIPQTPVNPSLIIIKGRG